MDTTKNIISLDIGFSRNSACYLEKSNNIKKIFIEGLEQVPSNAALYKDKWYFGSSINQVIHNPEVRTFKNWKLLLQESNQEILKENGYDSNFTPEVVMQKFLEYIITNILVTKKWNQIDLLGIAYPAMTLSPTDQFDYKSHISKMLMNIQYKGKQAIKEIRQDSEPVASAGYFIVEHQKRYKTEFVGRTIVLDMGGGTGDSSVLKIEHNQKTNSQDVITERQYGIGENSRSNVGNAGGAFFTGLTQEVCPELDENSVDFLIAYEVVEKEIIAKTDDILDMYDAKLDGVELTASNRLLFEQLKDVITTVDINNHQVDITLGMLAKVYFKYNYEAVEKLLNVTINFLNSKKINFGVNSKEVIKVVETGGFTRFALVQRQINSAFHRIKNDRRFENVPEPDNGVANGLAYLVNELITFKKSCPFSLGISNSTGSVKKICLEEGDAYETDVPKYILSKNKSGIWVKTLFVLETIPNFYFKKDTYWFSEKVCDMAEYIKSRITFNDDSRYYLGFSLDENKCIYLHVVDAETQYSETIKLDKMVGLLGGMIEIDQ